MRANKAHFNQEVKVGGTAIKPNRESVAQPSKTQKKQKRLRKRGTSENVVADKKSKLSKLEK